MFRKKMQGNSYFQDTVVNPELDHKAKKVSDKFSENLHIIANEPSLAFYRIQEHVRKSLHQLVDKKHEVQQLQQDVQGACFDMEYATNAIQNMESSGKHFHSIQELMKNAMFMKQQLTYEKSRRHQDRTRPSMYRTMMRTQTLDIPVGSEARDRRSADFTHSVQVARTPQTDDSPRARSSSLSLQHRAGPATMFR